VGAFASPFADQACLAIISPGALPYLEIYRDRLQGAFGSLTVILPQDLEHLHRLVAGSGEKFPLVMAIGGDGTVNQVVSRLNLLEQTLLVLPSGTGNDFARGLCLPLRFGAYITALPRFAVREVDVWTAGRRRFVNSAGFGLDGQILQVMASASGPAAHSYLLAFLLSLPRLTPQYLFAESEHGPVADGEVWWLAAMNTPFIGGGIRIAPAAEPDDGALDAVVVKACPRLELLCKLPRVLQGRHLKDSRVAVHRVSRLELGRWRIPVAAEIDGELTMLANESLAIAHAGRLKVACPAAGRP